MAYSLEEALKLCGYNDTNNSCSNQKALVLEMTLMTDGEDIAEQNGVDFIDEVMHMGNYTSESNHSVLTSTIIGDSAKDSFVSLSKNTPSGYAEWARIHPQTVSMSISQINLRDEMVKKMSEYSFMCAASGNSGFMDELYDTKKFFTLIGACGIESGVPKMREYSSYNDDKEIDYATDKIEYNVDFVAIDGFEWLGEKIYGTSFACPSFATLVMITYEQFYKQYKVVPTWRQIREFIIPNCEPVYVLENGKYVLSQKGVKHPQCGYGLYVLPKEFNFFKTEGFDIDKRLVDSVYVEDDTVIINSKSIDSASIVELLKISYLARRKMAEHEITKWSIIGGKFSSDTVTFISRSILNSHGMIDKIENGEM